jgi:hypothetical protein
MSLYRKKPVVIEAWRNDSHEVAPAWIGEGMRHGTIWFSGGPQPYFTIATLEGEMRAEWGDWIIRGVKGEVYPCKPDIFAMTYEPAHESTS